LEGGDKPTVQDRIIFLPMMLAHPLQKAEFDALNLDEFQVELKWDGIRLQITRAHDQIALFSRNGDDVTEAFPDIAQALLKTSEDNFTLDGELLTTRSGEIGPFHDLQQRLNRKVVTAQLLDSFPAHVRLYDMLRDRGDDIRAKTLAQRRQHLEDWYGRAALSRADLSPIVISPTHEGIEEIRAKARSERHHGVEGLMLKRRDSPYLAGRPRGHWFKWKRNTLTLDCVLMYAQRGSGKRSSYYSDYTFGVWKNENGARKLVPVGKTYSGFTDEELHTLDKWIRAHTTKRFGPVREVHPEIVMEIEYDSIGSSARHKSGVAMRFPRMHRLRWDKPAGDADTLETVQKLLAESQ
jgi:DNA ligase-1